MDTTTPLLTARVLIFNPAGEILLMLRSNPTVLPGLWELPGGKLDAGESASEAAVREVLEESGLQISVAGEPRIDEDVWDGRDLHTYLFTAMVPSLRPQLSLRAREHADAAWFAPDQLPALSQMTSVAARECAQLWMEMPA
jgi:8-oxo-dGTP pyrophosphatase MutT (NUDIX family)